MLVVLLLHCADNCSMIRLDYKRPIDEQSSLIQLFVRLVGLLWLVLMVDSALQWEHLCGGNGLLPARELASQAFEAYGPWHVFRIPSLLWISQSDGFAWALFGLGALGGLMALSDRLATLGLIFSWVVWLSFVNFGSDFFAYASDTFMLELGFLAVFASWLRNAGVGRKIWIACMVFLNLRFWISFASVRMLYAGAEGLDVFFLDDFLDSQAHPTPLAWHLSHAAEWVKDAISLMVLVLQLVLPVFLMMPSLRWIPALGFAILSIAWMLVGHEGILCFALLVSTLPLLLGTQPAAKMGAWLAKSERLSRYLRVDPQYQRMRSWPRKIGAGALQFQFGMQCVQIALLFLPFGNLDLNFLNYTAYRPETLEWESGSPLKSALLAPLRLSSNLRLVNPYGFRKGSDIPVCFQLEIFQSDSAGSGHYFPLRFRQDFSALKGFEAPLSSRLARQVHFLSYKTPYSESLCFHHLEGNKSCWTDKLLEAVWSGRARNNWFAAPAPLDFKPTAMRILMAQRKFSVPESKVKDGSWWETRHVSTAAFSHGTYWSGCHLDAGFHAPSMSSNISLSAK